MTDSKDEPPAPRDDCVIPHEVDPEALSKYLLKQNPFDGADEIAAYVEGESSAERVTYLERIGEERVAGRDYETWDVHTTDERYWVITNPTNLYSQRLFPSADYTLSFHVGLTTRVMSRRVAQVGVDVQDYLGTTWRKWNQAADALDKAREAEEFQAIGMRCREALLSLGRALADDTMVPAGEAPPKAADFVHWSELIANAFASGRRNAELRGYLKTTAQSTWQLVAKLTHSSGATSIEAEVAVEATRAVLATFGLALRRFHADVPSTCPKCSSYQIKTVIVGDLSENMPYASVCEVCGWHNARPDGIALDELESEAPGP